MNPIRTFTCTLLLASLAACQGNSPSTSTAPKQPASAHTPDSALGRLVDKELQEARRKLATENIGINGGVRVNAGKNGGFDILSDDSGNDTRPKAEITPKGDLLIDGKAVAINAEQRAMLLEYRGHVISVAEAGMEIGVQGADLATKAVGEAFRGIFSGKSEQDIEKAVEAEAEQIKQSAARLCGRLPAMMTTQQKLAASIPEFKPYATMTQEDIDECMKDSDERSTQHVQSEIREEIRDEIRSTVRGTVRETVRNEAQEAAEAAKDDADSKATTTR